MGKFILLTIIVGGAYLLFGKDEKHPSEKKLTTEQEIAKPHRPPDKGLAHDLKEWMIKNTPAK